jgi:hypothetical protein
MVKALSSNPGYPPHTHTNIDLELTEWLKW